jgi:hypothetical protein
MAKWNVAVDEIERVAREWPDGVHTCAELQRMEPGRRPCTCGSCPSSASGRLSMAIDSLTSMLSELKTYSEEVQDPYIKRAIAAKLARLELSVANIRTILEP